MNINDGGHGMQSEYTGGEEWLSVPGPSPDDSVAPVALRTRQPWARLLKAVLDLAGRHAELVRHADRDWSSATFSGSRHTITLCFCGVEAGAAGEAFIIALPDHAFAIPRYLVADAQIIAVDDRQLPEPKLLVEVELLLLDRA